MHMSFIDIEHKISILLSYNVVHHININNQLQLKRDTPKHHLKDYI